MPLAPDVHVPRLHTIRYNEPKSALPDGVSVTFGDDEDEDKPFDPLTENDDGSFTVNDPPQKKQTKTGHDANLALTLDESYLDTLASDLLQAIEEDLQSRRDWEETFNKGIDLLGLKIEAAASDISGGGGNISKAKDPLLLEAVLRYQSNFNAEMLPANGPVKVRDDKVDPPPPGADGIPPGSPPVAAAPIGMGHNGGPPLDQPPAMAGGGVPPMPPQAPPPSMGGLAPPPPPPPGAPQPPKPPMGGSAPPPGAPANGWTRSAKAEAVQKGFNHYLTVTDKAYYPDTDRMSFSQGLGGCAFKKVYMDPIENRPISRFVMANHLIVNNGASSLHDAKRKTHAIPNMSYVTLRQMMEAGAYRDIDLGQPTSTPGAVDQKIAETQGTQARTNRPEDVDYTIYECYCWLNIPGMEQKKKVPVPYRVTIEKDSRKVLEVRRDWKKGEKLFRQRRHFVKYPLFPGLGFYDYGFVHILGNTTRVLSAVESLMVDQGMFANFPGGVIDKMAARQETNQIRPGPGGFKPIDTGGRPIQQVVMPMPYKDVSANLLALAKGIQDGGRKLASISELPLGEGRADVPVGTVIALIEQNTKLLSAVHKRNHAAQQEEFELLKELFAEDPSALIKSNKDLDGSIIAEDFEDVDLVPASDPNVSSHIMRIMKAQAVLTIMQQTPPGMMNIKEGITRALRAIGEEDIDALFLPPQPQNQQPAPHQLDAMAKAQALQQKTQSDQQKIAANIKLQTMKMQDNAADRASNEKIELQRLQGEAVKHVGDIQQQGLQHAADLQQQNQHHATETQADLVKHFSGLQADAEQAQQQLQSTMGTKF